MSRVSGYKVKIEGFLPVEKGNLDSVIETANALKAAKASGKIGALIGKMTGITVTEKMGSATVDENGHAETDETETGEGEAAGEGEAGHEPEPEPQPSGGSRRRRS